MHLLVSKRRIRPLMRPLWQNKESFTMAQTLLPIAPAGTGASTGAGAATSSEAGPAAGGLFGKLLTLGSAASQKIGLSSMAVALAKEGTAADGTASVQQDLQTLIGQLLGQQGADANLSGQLQVQGGVQQLTVMVQQVQVVVTQLQQAGVDFSKLGTDAGQLASALHTLGMPSDQAALVASRITAALNLIRQQAQLSAGDTNALALVLAASAQPAQASDTAWEVKITSASATFTQTSWNLKEGWAQAKTDAASQSTDLAQMLAGLGMVQAPIQLPQAQAKAEATDILSAPAQPPVPTLTAGSQGFVAQGAVADGTPVIVRHPDAADTAVAAVTTQGAAGISPLTGAVAQQVVNPQAAKEVTQVNAADVLSKPVGEVMYEWKPSETGVETLTATPAVHKALQDAMASTPQPQGQWTVTAPAQEAAPQASGLAHFSAQLAHAMRAGTTQQAVVQIQALTQQGGGTVRVQLHPKDLGEINIQLTVQNGSVHGAISATDTAVVEVLARDMHQLKESFAAAGLKVADQGISLMLNNNPQQNPGQQQQGNPGTSSGPASVAGITGTEEAAPPAATAWVSPDRILDVSI